jgi:flagellar biosynthesis/type III secretory pathway protein FliH
MQNFITKPTLAITRSAIGIKPGAVRITANEYEELVAINDAWDKARSILLELEKQADTMRERYRQEGLEAGRADAQKQALEQVANMHNSMQDWVKTTDSQLIELVNRCVGEVINKTDHNLLVASSVEKGLAQLACAQQIIVRVHPLADSLDDQIASLVQKYGITGQVRVVQDGSLAPGDVVIESPVGIVDLRLDKQLSHINKALAV